MADPHYNRTHRWKKHRSRHQRRTTQRRSSGRKSTFKKTLGTIFSKGFLTNIGLLAAVAVAGLFVIFGGMFLFLGRNLPDPNALQDRSVAQSTKIYDRTGEHLLFEFFVDEKRTLIQLEDLPDDLVNGVIATEDTKFYSHMGVRPFSILRAVVVGILPNQRIAGTSTLTQQLVKNAILTNERSITRKVKEVILSLRLEQKYSKDEILQIYFNEIPYGSTNYGVEAAANDYFGKSVTDLTLAESATLAGMPKAPTTYLNNPDRLRERRDFVLRRMFEEGYISEEQKNAAQEEELVLQRSIDNIVAPHFVFYVKELLEQDFDFTSREIEEGGYKVITSLDYDLQEFAQAEVATAVEERGESYNFSNAALVAMDPKNGQVLAMVGSHDYFDEESDGAVNVALRPRQPGSSIKPMAYAALFENGYTPNTVFYDVETDFPSDVGVYHPRNYDLQERGPVTVRTALQGSLNIPAVKALYMVGVQNFLDFAERLGYTTFEDRSRFGLSLTLGGGEVTLLEHTNTYATFANDGVRHDSVSILRIEDAQGKVLHEWEEAEGERVVDADVVRMTSNVMSDDAARAYAFGAGGVLTLPGRPVAAKSGTTNDYRDGWLMGYTPSIAMGVWGGNNDNSEMARGAGGSSVAGPIWNAVMRHYLSGKPAEGFPSVEIPELGKPALDGDLGNKQTLLVDRITGLLATDETPERLREERTYVTHHAILHYVDKNDPLGPAPGADSKDPQYGNWESAVQDWVARQEEELGEEFVNEEPPTEYDDVHVARNIPEVTIREPDGGDELDSRTFTIEARVSARREISRVEAYIDGFYLGATSASPYRINVTVPSFVSMGQHTLRVVAFDDVENEGQDTITVRVPGGEESDARLQIVDPRPGQIIVATEPTYNIRLELSDPDLYEKIEFFAGPRTGSGGTLLGTVNDPSRFIEQFTWTLPGPGEYIVSALATLKDGNDVVSAGNVILQVEAPAPELEEEEQEETE